MNRHEDQGALLGRLMTIMGWNSAELGDAIGVGERTVRRLLADPEGYQLHAASRILLDGWLRAVRRLPAPAVEPSAGPARAGDTS